MNKKYTQYREQYTDWPDQEKLTDFPTDLAIELNGQCNLQCEMCESTWRRNKKKDRMSFEVFKAIIEEASSSQHFCSITFMGSGEATLRTSELLDCISFARTKNVLDIRLTTHGNWDMGLIKQMHEAGLTYLRISLDAFSPETYGLVRKGGNFFQAYSNAIAMCGFNKKMRLAVSFVKQKSNEHEIDRFKEFWEKMPVNVICTGRWELNAINPYNYTPKCLDPWRRLIVTCTGNLFPCCSGAYNDRNKNELLLGNAKTHSIKEVWVSPMMQKLRKMHSINRQGNVDTCLRCTHICCRNDPENSFNHPINGARSVILPQFDPSRGERAKIRTTSSSFTF